MWYEMKDLLRYIRGSWRGRNFVFRIIPRFFITRNLYITIEGAENEQYVTEEKIIKLIS